jgi:hypothetical protein
MGPNATSLLSLEVGEFCQKGKGCGSLSRIYKINTYRWVDIRIYD